MTPTQRETLEYVERICGNFDGAITGATHRLRTMRALERMGFVKDGGLGVVCDGDGYTAGNVERYRAIWTITKAGKKALEES